MKTISVHASKEYLVKIGAHLLPALGQEAAAIVKGRRAAVVSDSNVWPFYGETVEKSLVNSGFRTVSFVFPSGESSKNGETYLQLLGFLAENQLTRSDCIIALGGGVVGDLAGFAAATYLRGIAYIQVPTSLLAMVDSSVGGKTAIDLPTGKNLAGAFYQPDLVLCDIESLSSLPREQFTDGCAEIIKYALLFDEKLFAQLEHYGLAFPQEQVIARCVELKRDIVAQDEFDTGLRQLLNLGHTVGHAIEKATNYSVSHGRAVAIGMTVIAKAAAAHDLCNNALVAELENLLHLFHLPTTTSLPSEALLHHIRSDKKRSADKITLIIPESIGFCKRKTIPVSGLDHFLKAGM